jgi:hypothetical protein
MALTSFTHALVDGATVDITLRMMRSHELHGTHQFYTRAHRGGKPSGKGRRWALSYCTLHDCTLPNRSALQRIALQPCNPATTRTEGK